MSQDNVNVDPEKGATEPLTKGSGDEPASPSKVKFTQGSPDGKVTEAIDIVSPGKTGYGLSKSELMVYANDPTWKRVRTGVFVLFWVVWVAMLAASVYIVSTTSCKDILEKKKSGL